MVSSVVLPVNASQAIMGALVYPIGASMSTSRMPTKNCERGGKMGRMIGMFFLVVAAAQVCADEPRVICADIPPFAFVERDQAQGLAYDLGSAIMKRLAYRGKIEIQPLARAQYTIQTEPNVISLWLGRIPEREKTVQWISPILNDAFSIYTLSGKPAAENLASARQIGVLGANIGAANAIEAKKNGLVRLELVSSDEANGKKLIAGRISGWITLQVSADFFVARNPIPDGKLVRGVKLGDYQAWIVASHAVNQETVLQWQKAFLALRQDGTLARIYGKYRISLPNIAA